MSKFLERFFNALNGEYNSLKLSAVNLHVKERKAEFAFVCPENDYSKASENLKIIEKAVIESYKTDLDIKVKITKSHFDEYFFTLNIIKFFDSHASLKNCITKRDILFELKDGKNLVKLRLKESIYALFEGRKILTQLNDFVCSNYCESIEIIIDKSDEEEEFAVEEDAVYVYDTPDGRQIDTIPISAIVGNIIHDKPIYIADAVRSKEGKEKVVLCGKVSELREFQRKQKESTSENIDVNGCATVQPQKKQLYNFYKFNLNDTTSSVSCVYFANEKTHEAIKSLKEGQEVIVSGKLENNVFNGTATLNLYASRISLTEFPKDFKINRLKCVVPNEYKLIFPKPYEEYRQESVFSKPEPVAEYLRGKSFCIFDIETTGLSTLSDRIIEIGAVKVVDGAITQTFSALIDPQMPISAGAAATHGITDKEVKNAPLIDEILPDFLKFSADSVLMGYNSEMYDYLILSRQSQECNIYFDNQRLDLMVLSKKHLKLHNYKLDTVARHFNIVNEQAHRALNDAITTAKAFIKLARLL